MLFPRGNKSVKERDFVSVFLDFPEAPFTPPQLCPKTQFELVAINQEQESKSIRRGLPPLSLRALTLLCPEASHVFTSEEMDWGFPRFLPLRDTRDPTTGFVVNDTFLLTVNITVQRDMQMDRQSRRQTGFVGLKARGDNGFINAFLNYLYHVRRFRKVEIRALDVMDAKVTIYGLGGLSHAYIGDG